MKIDQLLSSFDDHFSLVSAESGMNIFEFLLQVFSMTDEKDCEPLAVVSAKLKQMMKTNPNMPNYHNAECLSDATMLMHSLLTRLHVAGIPNGLQYLADHNNPTTLLGLKDALLEIQEESSPEYLAVYKQVYGIKGVNDVLSGVCIQGGRLTAYEGMLSKCANIKSFQELGLCYTTSADDVHALDPNYIVCDNQVYPVFVNKSRFSIESITGGANCIRAEGVNISIPVVSI